MARMRDMTAYGVLVGRPEVRRPFGKPKRRRANNIINGSSMSVMERRGLGSSG
jgi:hypothetical protein